MSDVKRYEPANAWGQTYMAALHSGGWVKHDDYAELETRLEEVENERDALIVARDMMGRLWEQAEARAERAEAALATAQRDALEEAAQFVESHEVGVNPRTGYVVAPSMIEGTQGTHAGMAYATAIRTLAAFDTTGGKDE
jgi:hypothetical protein